MSYSVLNAAHWVEMPDNIIANIVIPTRELRYTSTGVMTLGESGVRMSIHNHAVYCVCAQVLIEREGMHSHSDSIDSEIKVLY